MRGVNGLAITLRFALLLFLQVFVFRQIGLGWGGADYAFVFVAPLFVATLPLRTPRPVVVLLGFAFGLAVDVFYETLGLHAAAGTLLGYGRYFALAYLEPRDGYKIKANPEGRALPGAWWVRYAVGCVAAYVVTYFSLEAFSPVFWQQIMLKSLLTVPLSTLVCLVVVAFLRPRL